MRDLRVPIAGALVLLATLQVASAMHLFGWGDPPAATVPARIAIGGPFRLTAADGRVVTDRDFRGRWMLVYFGYTNCPDTCPTALNDIAGALDMLGTKAADVASVFITVDPAHDTPAVMGAYTARFDRRILGLTGPPAAIDQAKAAYRVYAAPAPARPSGGMVMDHSSVLIIMDPQGRFADVLNGDSAADVIAARLRGLIG